MLSLLPEWTPQSGVLITWPHQQADWWAWQLQAADATYAAFTKEISLREKVIINCLDIEHQKHILRVLTEVGANLNSIHCVIVKFNDVWTRDYGPLTLGHQNKLMLLDFGFNGWGNKYPHHHDDKICAELMRQNVFGDLLKKRVAMIMEGGSLEVDGCGTLLTTKNCLLAKTRNPHLNLTQIEESLKNYLNVKRVLWLNEGAIKGDDTDGHIDTLARFCDAKTICYVSSDDETDENYFSLKQMEKELQSFVDYEEKPYRLIPLPSPKAIIGSEGKQLPATYANFLIINDAVLVPTYDDAADDEALSQMTKAFPDREIIGIPCRPLIENFGSLHCVTMQLPEGVIT